MPNYVPSIAVDEVIDALRNFMAPFVTGGLDKLVRGQVNRVPLPDDPCVVLTELLVVDLSMPSLTYRPDDGLATIAGPSRIDVQLDFYGVQSGDICKAVQAAFRTLWAYNQFVENIRPLYTSDAKQMPLVTGEQQYEARWTLTASMQYNPSVTVPQQFADELSATVRQADS